MSQAYSNPARADDDFALPDIEVFYLSPNDVRLANLLGGDEPNAPGWYYWYCFPGCLPDSDPIGPYATEQEAIDAAHDGSADLAEQHDDYRNNA